MPIPIHRRIVHWIFNHLVWDSAGSARLGLWGGLWAARKLLVALAVAALLTWREWMEHHPPEIALIAVIHFLFVMVVIALLVLAGQWFRRSAKTSLGQ